MWAVVTNDLYIRRCRAQSNTGIPVNISDEQPPLILVSVALEVFEQATQATTRENLSCGFPTKRVSNQSFRLLNRLARKLIFFARGKSRDDSSQKADNKVADDIAWMRRLVWAFIVTNHRNRFSQSGSHFYMCHLTMTKIRKQDAKYGYREI